MGEADGRQCQPVESQRRVNWAPGDWTLRVQSTQTFDVSDADGKKIDGYNTVDFGSYALPVGKVSFSVENVLDKDYTTAGDSAHRGCIAQRMAHRVCIPIKAVAARLV